MNWIYSFRERWLHTDSSPAQSVYLRPVMVDGQGDRLVGKIIELSVIAVEYFMQDEFKAVSQETGLDRIYFDVLSLKDHHIREEENEQPDLYLHMATLFVKDRSVTPADMRGWMKVYLDTLGLACSGLDETGHDAFADTNPLYRAITEGARKMEDKWGKGWWRSDK